MADLSRIDWTAGETPVLATVLNNIGADIRTAGANRDLGGFQIVNCGGITSKGGTFRSGAAGTNTQVTVGRTATEATIAIAAGASQFATAAATGDLIVRSESQKVIIGSGGNNAIIVSAANYVGIGVNPTYKFHVQGGRALVQGTSEPFALALAYDSGSQWMWHGGNAAGAWIVSDYGGNPRLSMTQAGIIKLHSTPVYADNTAAIAGGLTAGMQYRTSTGVRMECY